MNNTGRSGNILLNETRVVRKESVVIVGVCQAIDTRISVLKVFKIDS